MHLLMFLPYQRNAFLFCTSIIFYSFRNIFLVLSFWRDPNSFSSSLLEKESLPLIFFFFFGIDRTWNLNMITFLQVYRGVLPTGELVAIKRAQQGSMQGGLEFKTEIELLLLLHWLLLMIYLFITNMRISNCNFLKHTEFLKCPFPRP